MTQEEASAVASGVLDYRPIYGWYSKEGRRELRAFWDAVEFTEGMAPLRVLNP